MKIKMKISQPGYSRKRNFNVTSFLLRHSEKNSAKFGSRNEFGEQEIEVTRGNYNYGNKEEDPVFATLNKKFDQLFFKTYGETIDSAFILLGFRYVDGQSMLMMTKNSGYTLNGRKISKSNLLGAVSRVVYRSCFIRSAELMNRYIEDLLEVTPNVRYALENKTPYSYFSNISDENPFRRSKVEVRFNTKRISKTSCALELSENIWASISIDELDKYLNHYRLGYNRGKKWPNISPSNLWAELFGKEPTESEYAMMLAWLSQNRTDKQIESRSMGLVEEVARENENIMHFNWHEDGSEKMGMIIRGSLADWILLENSAAKTSPQRVSIFTFNNKEDMSLNKMSINLYSRRFMDGHISGPICVNNAVGRVSLGDQFVSRAFTLMNDKLAVKMVGTLRSHIPDSNTLEDKHRVDFNLLVKFLKKNTLEDSI